MSNDKPVSVILNAAADDLEVNGWRRGSVGMEPSGPHCLVGSIASVVGVSSFDSGWHTIYSYGELYSHPAVVAVAEHLGLRLECDNLRTVWGWNDDLNRTADEVIAALRAAAVIAASRETEPTTQPSGEAVSSRG